MQSIRMMKRLQTVRCTSDAATGPAAGVEGGAGLCGTFAARSARVRSPGCALEVEIVIPDFSENRASPFGATRARDANDDRLCLRPRRELESDLLPVVRPGRRGR